MSLRPTLHWLFISMYVCYTILRFGLTPPRRAAHRSTTKSNLGGAGQVWTIVVNYNSGGNFYILFSNILIAIIVMHGNFMSSLLSKLPLIPEITPIVRA